MEAYRQAFETLRGGGANGRAPSSTLRGHFIV